MNGWMHGWMSEWTRFLSIKTLRDVSSSFGSLFMWLKPYGNNRWNDEEIASCQFVWKTIRKSQIDSITFWVCYWYDSSVCPSEVKECMSKMLEDWKVRWSDRKSLHVQHVMKLYFVVPVMNHFKQPQEARISDGKWSFPTFSCSVSLEIFEFFQSRPSCLDNKSTKV